ncbi:MAG TPA: hypothetical protein VMT89_18705 [Candidatus Acidoferrales bacterium]|nr:hypothetical protein [Candidatus Acidoferrales bacterium]
MRHRHRQERWLHTRISPDLEEALKREARKQRTPVSLLVRNVLEGALDLVEGIVEDSFDIADTSRRFARRISRAAQRHTDEVDDVYGWQELILNRPSACSACEANLDIGGTAFRGLTERSGPPVFLCVKCVRELRTAADRRKEEHS